MGYGPRMTAKQRRNLIAEIKAFDEKATLARIEREAVGRKDINAYEDWRVANPGPEPVEANPDQLTDDCPSPWGQAANADLTGLSPREIEAWRWCMEHGLSRESAAIEMKTSEKTVKGLLQRAKRKLKGKV